jgi:hypothetical protein
MSTRGRVLIALVAAVVGPLATAASARAAWSRPVAATVARGFDLGRDPFAPGQHRGVDFAAPPGTTVRAPCVGRVVVARRIGTSGGVVTVGCGRWRVSLLPLARIDVSEGEPAWPGRRLGAAGRSRDHAGLHLGVRRAGRRFGYVDPLRFLNDGAPTGDPPVPGIAPRGRRPPAPAPPVATARPRPMPARPRPMPARPRPMPARLHPMPARRAAVAGPRRVAVASRVATVAPPLAWAGLAVLLLGAVGLGGVRTRSLRARTPGRLAPVARAGGRLRS